jgi:drug/metabolite transporter (DMT)-like permease
MVDPPMNAVAAPRRALSANAQGALWMLLSAVTFTAMTTLIKFLGKDYPAPLQAFYRQAAGLAVLAPWILRNPARPSPRRDPASWCSAPGPASSA